MTLIVDDPWHAYPTQHAVWMRFYSLFAAADGLIFYADIFKRYFIEAIHEFFMDNVQYFEFRALLPSVSVSNSQLFDIGKHCLINLIKKICKLFFLDI